MKIFIVTVALSLISKSPNYFEEYGDQTYDQLENCIDVASHTTIFAGTKVIPLVDNNNKLRELIMSRRHDPTSQNKESLQELWNRLSKSTSTSLLKKYLTPDVFSRLNFEKTRYYGTLADCIRSGCMNPESEIGIHASDPDAYDTFSDVFYPIIRDCHKVKELEQPDSDFGDANNLDFGNLDPDGKFIKSVRISVRRSHANYSFPSTITKEDRLAMEKMTVGALNTLPDELTGSYLPLSGRDQYTPTIMTEVFSFKTDTHELRDAEVYRDWPNGRGIFVNTQGTFLVFLNGEDHLHIVSMQKSGYLAQVWQRLVTGLQGLSKNLNFARHPKLGFLTFSPTNLGTALTVNVKIRLPYLSKVMTNFRALCEKLELHLDSVGQVFDISNNRRMGLTEVETVKQVRDGIRIIIKQEVELQNKDKL